MSAMAEGSVYDTTNFGQLACALAGCTHEQLEAAIAYQLRHKVHLGQALVDLGTISEATRQELLAKQKQIRSGTANTKDVLAIVEYAFGVAAHARTKMSDLMVQVKDVLKGDDGD